MGLAIVRLKWPPGLFWAATPHEFYSAIEVFDEMRKAQRDGQ